MKLVARQRSGRLISRGRGFTIIELAVVLVIVSLLIGSFLYPLSTQVDQRNTADTQRRLEEIREALVGYAIANGRFPCPAAVSSPPASTDSGQEATPFSSSSGVCPSYAGYVPGKILGLNNLDSQGFALDAWGSTPQSRIRYAITNANLTGVAGTATFTGNGATSSMRAAGTSAIGSSGNVYLYVCASSAGITAPACGSTAPLSMANALSNGDAVFVIYSVGKDLASQQTFGNATFWSQPVATQTFDDQVLWVSRFAVISRLVSAGQLP